MVYILNTSATLRKGDRGDDVRHLQTALNALGFPVGAADGAFGGGTKEALQQFQAASGLTADGVSGKNTNSAIVDALTQLGGADNEALGEIARIVDAAQPELVAWLSSGYGLGVDANFLASGQAQIEAVLEAIRNYASNASV